MSAKHTNRNGPLLVPNMLLSQTVHNNPGEVVQGASAACVHDVPTGRLVQCTAGPSLHKAQPHCRSPAVPPPPNGGIDALGIGKGGWENKRCLHALCAQRGGPLSLEAHRIAETGSPESLYSG